MTLSRCGYKKYTFAKFSSAFITGFLVAAIGIATFNIIVYKIFASLSEFGEGASWYYDSTYKSAGYAVAAKVINNSLVCGMYAIIALIICLIIKDKFFTLSIFMVINYFSTKLDVKYMNSVPLTDSKNRALRALFPNNQTLIYSIFPNELNISFYWYLVFVFVMYVVITIISYLLIKRRYKCAS